MAIEVLIHNKSDPSAHVRVKLTAIASGELFSFDNRAMKDVSNMEEPLTKTSPFVTPRSIESACMSGAIFARRKLKLKGLTVELLDYSVRGRVENAAPFATATMIGVCRILGHSAEFSDGELGDWNVEASDQS